MTLFRIPYNYALGSLPPSYGVSSSSSPGKPLKMSDLEKNRHVLHRSKIPLDMNILCTAGP